MVQILRWSVSVQGYIYAYADFKRILNLVDDHYRQEMNQTKAERKGKTPYTKKIYSMYCLDSVYTARFLMVVSGRPNLKSQGRPEPTSQRRP